MAELNTISWEASEFEYRSKGVSWYWLTIIIAVFLVALATWQRNFLFGVFIVIAEVLVLAWGNRTPATVAFEMSEKEFAVGKDKRYAWSEFENFSAEGGEKIAVITLRFHHRMYPSLKMLLPADRFEAVKRFLGERLPQIDDPRSFVDTLEELFRF